MLRELPAPSGFLKRMRRSHAGALLFTVDMMPNLESFDGFSAQLLGNQLCALGLSDG